MANFINYTANVSRYSNPLIGMVSLNPQFKQLVVWRLTLTVVMMWASMSDAGSNVYQDIL